MEKIFNNNLKLLVNIGSSYIKGMNEWFLSYMVAIYLTILFVLIAFSSVVFGASIMVDFYLELFALLMGVHVFMSLKAIIHDYIYNRYIVRICTNMSFFIVLAVLIEILKN